MSAIRGTRIVAIRSGFDGPAHRRVDCGGCLVLPGRVAFLETQASDPGSLLARGITSVVTPHYEAFGGAPQRLWRVVAAATRFAPAQPGQSAGTARPIQPFAIARDDGTAVQLLRDGVTVIADRMQTLAAVAARGVDVQRFCLSQPDQAAMPAGISAAQLAQWSGFNLAVAFALEHEIGSVTPGRRADLLLCDNPGGAIRHVVFDGALLPSSEIRPC